ncbi:response regulator [Myceligenerans xiligouense]|uniref:histidine kinase n=1 Tax=Myceligenerans xiligouense TaxID=253184 RepID=A0A3N4YLP9_9MICO|nr:response regulator [Myceligenerans xiligouense]RPF21583.1 PAS domain S-box-containing protein [Myceligenerans xiligouense]
MESRRATARAHVSFVRWCWAAGTALLLLVLTLSGPFDQTTRGQISMAALAAAGVLTALSCGWRAARSTGRRRRAWAFLSAGGAVGLTGNIYAGLVGDPETGDAAYIAALLLGVVGLSFFPTVRPRGQELVRMLLDSVVVGGSVLYIAVFAVVLDSGVRSQPALTVYALPVVDALLATLAMLVMTRSSAVERVPLVLVGGGFVLYAVADVAFALLSATDGFTFGSPVDAGWVGGYVAIALAARHPAASGPADVTTVPMIARPGDGTPLLGTVVTFSLFLAAALVRVGQQGLPWAANALWILVLVAVVVRQVLVVADNESLRHGLERRVRERTAQLRSLASERERTLDSVADGIYGVDPEGLVTFVNAAGAHTLAASADDLVGRDAHATFHAPDENGIPFPVDRCYLTGALRDGVTVTAEQDVYLRLDGKEVPVEVTASPLRDEGRIRGAVVAFRDITERREMEDMKDDFVSVVSHELRTPLTAIRGALGLVGSDALASAPEQVTRMINIALTSSERLGRLVDDILDVERLEAGTTPLRMAEHRVDALVAAAVDQVSVLADEAGIDLSFAGSSEIVLADDERIVQTLTNLLGNALRFSPRGGAVRVKAIPAGDLVELRVDDEGRGIPPDKLEAVFRRFEQLDTSDSRERGGSGLGLAIARSIVERHGGRAWAVSEGEERGSSFRFTLRRVTPSAPRAAERPPEPASLATRVVVVDDDPNVVEVLRTVLEQRGYDVVGVTDGQEAFDAIDEEHPAAIVLDLAMPGTGGAEILSRLRRTAATADVPVVVVSGTRPYDALETAALADGWLVKPVEPAFLIETVRDVIRRQPHHGRLLVIEDDDALRSVVAKVLENGGLAVAQARTVDEARHALAYGADPDLILLDLGLPDGTGHELVTELRRDGRLRRVPLVVYSGAEVGAEEREGLRLGHTVFLTKGRTAPDDILPSVLDLLDAAAGHGGVTDEPGEIPSTRT